MNNLNMEGQFVDTDDYLTDNQLMDHHLMENTNTNGQFMENTNINGQYMENTNTNTNQYMDTVNTNNQFVDDSGIPDFDLFGESINDHNQHFTHHAEPTGHY